MNHWTPGVQPCTLQPTSTIKNNKSNPKPNSGLNDCAPTLSDTWAGSRLQGYRSGLESAIADSAKTRGHRVTFESHKVPYLEPATKHTYTPDFILENGIVIESKGRFLSKDRKKHLLVRKQHPDLDIRFVFSRAKAPIYKGSKTSCAQWAEKNGFRWAEKDIPESWFKEPVFPYSLAALESMKKK